MAYVRNKMAHSLQLIYNHGQVEGKTLRKNKTYADVSTDDAVSTPEACILTAKAIGSLTIPLLEDINTILKSVNIQTS